jgi:hypothetical protein
MLSQREPQDLAVANAVRRRSLVVTGQVLLSTEHRSVPNIVQGMDEVLMGFAQSPAQVCQAEHSRVVW